LVQGYRDGGGRARQRYLVYLGSLLMSEMENAAGECLVLE